MKAEPTTTKLRLSKIRTDGGTQPRAEIDQGTVDLWAEAIEAGTQFPPVDVFYDGTDHWLANGFTRFKAHQLADLREIACVVYQGTLRDAQLFSFTANLTNGQVLAHSDRRRAALTMLRDAEWSRWNNCEIARHVGVDEKTIRTLRKELSSENPKMAEERLVNRNGTTYPMKTAQIGAKSSQAAERKELEEALAGLTPEDRAELLQQTQEDGRAPRCAAERWGRVQQIEALVERAKKLTEGLGDEAEPGIALLDQFLAFLAGLPRD
jgi:hypothetical protein